MTRTDGIRLVVHGDVDMTTGDRLESELLRAEREQPGDVDARPHRGRLLRLHRACSSLLDADVRAQRGRTGSSSSSPETARRPACWRSPRSPIASTWRSSNSGDHRDARRDRRRPGRAPRRPARRSSSATATRSSCVETHADAARRGGVQRGRRRRRPRRGRRRPTASRSSRALRAGPGRRRPDDHRRRRRGRGRRRRGPGRRRHRRLGAAERRLAGPAHPPVARRALRAPAGRVGAPRRRVRAAAPRAGPHRHGLRAHRPGPRGQPDRLRQRVVLRDDRLPARGRPRAATAGCCRARRRDPDQVARLRRAIEPRAARSRSSSSTTARTARRSATRCTSRRCATTAAASSASSACRSTSRPRAGRRRCFASEQQARRDAEEAERRSAFLAAASPLLDASLDLRSTLEALARVTVPHLADLCLVDVLARRRGPARRVRRRPTRSSSGCCARCRARYTVDERRRRSRSSASSRTGRTELLARRARRRRLRRLERRAGRPAAPGGDARPAQGAAAARSACSALASLDPDRRFGDAELTLAEDLARRAALAVDNARLFEQQSSISRVLQDSLLPDRLPALDGIELGAAYRPAGDGTEIGGDFYDAFPANGGGIALAIGDVTGKGAKAAALTGLTRHTLRTAAMYEHEPERDPRHAQPRAARPAQPARQVLHGRARAACGPNDGHVDATVACAGHPLPLILRADGEVESVGRPGTRARLRRRPAPARRARAAARRATRSCSTPTASPRRGRKTGLLGDERFASLVRGCAGLDAGSIAARLERAAIESPAGPPARRRRDRRRPRRATSSGSRVLRAVAVLAVGDERPRASPGSRRRRPS